MHGAAMPSRAASTIQVLKMCEAFEAEGHSVHLIVPDKPDVEPGVTDVFEFYGVRPLAGFHKVFWPGFRGGSYLSAIAMAKHASHCRAELVYSRFMPAAWFAASIGMPVIHEAHRAISDASRGERLMYRSILRKPKFNYLVSISEALKERLAGELEGTRGRVLVAHDGADVVPDSSGSAIVSHSAGLKVGYVGSLNPGKGAELLVPLATACPFAHFHIVGGTDDAVAALRERTRDLPNLSVHGFRPHRDAVRFMLEMDVLLAPYGERVAVHGAPTSDVSKYMSPLKLFEYMAAGRAILCSDHPVLQEVVSDGETALICGRSDVEQWRSSLLKLAQAPELRIRLGLNAKQEFESRYSWRARARLVLSGLEH